MKRENRRELKHRPTQIYYAQPRNPGNGIKGRGRIAPKPWRLQPIPKTLNFRYHDATIPVAQYFNIKCSDVRYFNAKCPNVRTSTSSVPMFGISTPRFDSSSTSGSSDTSSKSLIFLLSSGIFQWTPVVTGGWLCKNVSLAYDSGLPGECNIQKWKIYRETWDLSCAGVTKDSRHVTAMTCHMTARGGRVKFNQGKLCVIYRILP
jgi:hypothetical protein